MNPVFAPLRRKQAGSSLTALLFYHGGAGLSKTGKRLFPVFYSNGYYLARIGNRGRKMETFLEIFHNIEERHL